MAANLFRSAVLKFSLLPRSTIFTLKSNNKTVHTTVNTIINSDGWDSNLSQVGRRKYATVEKEEECKQFSRKDTAKYKPVTHVIFDLDGTILNSEDILFEAAKRYICRVFKKTLTMDLYGLAMGALPDVGADIIIKELDLPISSAVFLHGTWQSLRLNLLYCEEMPGINYLACHFERCKVPIAIASCSTQKTYDLKAKKHKKLFSRFCPIVLGGSEPKLAKGKPYPDILLMTANKFVVPPECPDQVLVIEDSVNGVRAAKAAGMQVVMVPHPCLPSHLVECAQPTLLLDSLMKFNPKIFNLPGFPGS